MVHSHSDLSELVEAFRAGEGVDLICESIRMVMQEPIETEATEQIGASRYERTEPCAARSRGRHQQFGCTTSAPAPKSHESQID